MRSSFIQRQMPHMLYFALFIVSAGALASGSYSSGGGGPQANQVYNLGKSVFYKKLLCSECPLSDQEIDADQAAALISRLVDDSDLTGNLDEAEREAVVIYLQRRYRIN